jgi:hypothetical protein
MIASLPIELTAHIIAQLTDPADINALRLTGSDGYQYAQEFITTIDPPHDTDDIHLDVSKCLKAAYVCQFKRLQTCHRPIIVRSLTEVNDVVELSCLNHATLVMCDPIPDAITVEAKMEESWTQLCQELPAIACFMTDELKTQLRSKLLDDSKTRPAQYFYPSVVTFIQHHVSHSARFIPSNFKFNNGHIYSSPDTIELKNSSIRLPVNSDIPQILNVLPSHITTVELSRGNNNDSFDELLSYFEAKAPLPYSLIIHANDCNESRLRSLLEVVTSIRVRVYYGRNRVCPRDIHQQLQTIARCHNGVQNRQFPHVTSARIPIIPDHLPQFMSIFPHLTSVDLIHHESQPMANPQHIFTVYPNLKRIRIYTHDVPAHNDDVFGIPSAASHAAWMRNPKTFRKTILLRPSS